MDETQDAIEYQRVGWLLQPKLVSPDSKPRSVDLFLTSVCLQQIDEMLAGSLSPEDEDAVLAELEAITQVGLVYTDI